MEEQQNRGERANVGNAAAGLEREGETSVWPGGLTWGEEAGDNISSEQNLLIATCFSEKGKLTFRISPNGEI